MNHPKPEEWMPYLFNEAESETRRRLNQHLKACYECRQQIETWRHNLARLNRWKMPSLTPPAPILFPLLRWATATALILCVGFSLGRFTAAQADVAKVRAAIAPELRHELGRELAQFLHDEVERSATATLVASSQQNEQAMAAFAKALQARRLEDNRAIYTALDKLDTRSLAQFVSLKKDIETVALNTDAEFRDTARGLVQLVGYSPTGGK